MIFSRIGADITRKVSAAFSSNRSRSESFFFVREGFETELFFTAPALAEGLLTLLKLVLEVFLLGSACFLAELVSADNLLTFLTP